MNTSALRDETANALHAQLDDLLNGPSTLPDGSVATVLDDICVRQLHGFGFSVGLSCAKANVELPQEASAEAPALRLM